MKVARLFGVGLALLCTAMVSQSRAAVTGLYYDMQVASGGVSDGDANLQPDDYTVSANNKTVTFTSNFLSDVVAQDGSDQVTITMNVYADVLDAGNQINSYASLSITNTGGGTYHPLAAPTSSTSGTLSSPAYASAAAGGYLPTGGTGSNHFGNFHNNAKVVDSLSHKLATGYGDPYAAVGIGSATLAFARTDTGTNPLVGNMSATVDGTAGKNYNANGTGPTGTYTVTAANGGTNLGTPTSGDVAADYFVAAYAAAGNKNPMASNFSYLNYSTSNPDPNAVNGVATVTISGSSYAEVFLGQLSFTFSASNTGAAANINAIPIAYTNGNTPGSEWMQSVDLSSGTATNSVQYASSTLTGGYTTAAPGLLGAISIVTPAASSTGTASLSLTGTAADTRALSGTNGGTSINYTLNNTGTASTTGGWTGSLTSTGNPASFTPSPASGGVITSGGSTGISANVTSISVGPQTFTLAVNDATDSLSASTTSTINFVNERGFTNSGISLGRVVIGSSPTSSTAVTSLSSSATTATVTLASASGTTDGLSLNGAGGTFNGTNTSATYTLGGAVSGTAGPFNGTYTIAGTDEFNNALSSAATVAITGTAVNNRPLILSGSVPANVLAGSTWALTVSGTGADTSYTNPSLTAGSYNAASGLTVTGVAGTFAAATPTQTVDLTFSGTGAYTVTQAVAGSDLVSNSLVAKEGLNGEALNASGSVSIATTVGGATAAAGGSTGSLSSSFGQSLDAVVAAGATYNNLRSIVTGGTGNLGTVATIMAGSNNSGSAATVTMAWRTRATNELPGSATSPPMNNGAGAGFLSSDVVQLNGIGTSGSTVDSYVLDMTYSSSVLGGSSNEQNDYTSGHLYLGSLSTTSSTWVNATSLNSGEGSLVAANPSEFTHLNESYPALVSYLNTNDPGWTLSEIVGAWGVETTNALSGGDTVPNAWAVVNHDSDFAVVPEPSTIALLIAGGLVLLPVVRRRLKKTA